MPLVGARKRTYQNLKSRDKFEDKAECGKPKINIGQRSKGTALRNVCKDSLLKFNILCFPNSTGLKPFGSVQLESIQHEEQVIRYGGRVVKAEPRGFGKTSRVCNAALYAALFNLRRMVPVFSANMEKSKNQIMSRWKTELLNNDLLYWMFPETIWPFRCLNNKTQGAASQTSGGELTHIKWMMDRIVFPTVKGSISSGNILIALPLESARGATHTMTDGTILRPELCIFDDVQKDEDSDNPNTIRKLEDLIDHTALMLGGHSTTMSAVMNCTVRRADDLSETFLKKDGWLHVRYKMLEQPSIREKEFWLGEYADIRKRYDPESPIDQRRAQQESLALYLKNRKAADEGAVVTWEWAYAWADAHPVEISAIQHAYNILIDLGEDVFASECQNEPIRETGGLTILSPAEIRKKQSGYKRREFPPEVTVLVASVDMHPEILYWHVWAFEPGFTSYLIDDETFPHQSARNFNHDILSKPLSAVFPGHDLAATQFAGLNALLHGDESLQQPGLLRREFIRSDGVPMRISRCGIDSSGEAADAVNRFIRQSPFAAILTPTFGRYIGAKSMPMYLYTAAKKVGSGQNTHWVNTQGGVAKPPGVSFDANFWKTNFHRALALPREHKGTASIYMVENEEYWRRFSEACNSEPCVEVTAEGRTVYEFGEVRRGTVNHDFDCAVIARVMASKCGITSVSNPPKKVFIPLRERQQRRLERQGRS